MIKTQINNRKKTKSARRVRMGVGLHDRDQGVFVGHLSEHRYLASIKLNNGNGSKYDPATEDAKHKAD